MAALLNAARAVANAFKWVFWKFPVAVVRALLAHVSNVLAIAWLGGLAAFSTTVTVRAVALHKAEVAALRDAGLEVHEPTAEEIAKQKEKEKADHASYFADGFEDPETVMMRQLAENDLPSQYDFPPLPDGGRPLLDGGRYSMDGGAIGMLKMLQAVQRNRGQPRASDVAEIRQLMAESNNMSPEEVDLMFPDGGILEWLKRRRDWYKAHPDDGGMAHLMAELLDEDGGAAPRSPAPGPGVAGPTPPRRAPPVALADGGVGEESLPVAVSDAPPPALSEDGGVAAQPTPSEGVRPAAAPAVVLPPLRDVRDVGNAALSALKRIDFSKRKTPADAPDASTPTPEPSAPPADAGAVKPEVPK